METGKGLFRGDTMKSNNTDMTTDMFFSMLNNGDNNNKPNIGHVNTSAPVKNMNKDESINGFGFGGLNNNLFGLGNISTLPNTNALGDESTPRNNTLLPVTQASMNRDFSIVSPNNIIGNNRMRLNPTQITPLMNNKPFMGTQGSFNLG